MQTSRSHARDVRFLVAVAVGHRHRLDAGIPERPDPVQNAVQAELVIGALAQLFAILDHARNLSYRQLRQEEPGLPLAHVERVGVAATAASVWLQ